MQDYQRAKIADAQERHRSDKDVDIVKCHSLSFVSLQSEAGRKPDRSTLAAL